MADVAATWSFAAVVANAQSPSAPQPKLLKQLEAHWTAGLHERPSATVEEAKSCLDRILVLGKADDATFDRVAGFIARATAVPGGGFLQAPVLAHACARSTVKDRHVRSRACQFIAAVLASLPADADVDANVAAGLTSAMIARARDKIVGVRVAAVGECASRCPCPCCDLALPSLRSPQLPSCGSRTPPREPSAAPSSRSSLGSSSTMPPRTSALRPSARCSCRQTRSCRLSRTRATSAPR